MDSGFRRNDGFVVNRISRLRNNVRIQAHTKCIVNSNPEGFSTTPQEAESGPRADERRKPPEPRASGETNANITRLDYIEPSAGAMFLTPLSFQYRAAPA